MNSITNKITGIFQKRKFNAKKPEKKLEQAIHFTNQIISNFSFVGKPLTYIGYKKTENGDLETNMETYMKTAGYTFISGSSCFTNKKENVIFYGLNNEGHDIKYTILKKKYQIGYNPLFKVKPRLEGVKKIKYAKREDWDEWIHIEPDLQFPESSESMDDNVNIEIANEGTIFRGVSNESTTKKYCTPANNLVEDVIYVIEEFWVQIAVFKGTSKLKYILKFKDIDKKCLSNVWIEDILDKLEVSTDTILYPNHITIRCVGMKYNKVGKRSYMNFELN